MTEHELTVDVYASWDITPPKYRIYVDNDLLTERDFVWGRDTYICERILVNLEPGTHVLKVEQTNTSGTICTKNIKLNGSPSSEEFVTTE
jgi:hypothetical protein